MAIRARAEGRNAKKAWVWEGPGRGPNLSQSRVPWGRVAECTESTPACRSASSITPRAPPVESLVGEPGTGKSVIKNALKELDPKTLLTPTVKRTLHTYHPVLHILGRPRPQHLHR